MSSNVREGRSVKLSGYGDQNKTDAGWVEAREVGQDHIEIVVRKPSNKNYVGSSVTVEGTREEIKTFAAQLMNLAVRTRL